MTVIDVGAHIGYYSVLAGKLVGETGRVHAVEPSAENREILRRNIDLNRVRSVTLHPYAAGRERATSLSSHRLQRLSRLLPASAGKTVRTIEIEAVPL
jgi:FkbM family methyltransferase